jgi:hypothetical protein
LIEWHGRRDGRAIAFALGAVCLVPGGVVLFGHAFLPRLDFLPSLRARVQLAAVVPVGGTVLLFTETHPITVRDSSYYGSPLWDGQDRLCRAVRGFQWNRTLPTCDFGRILRDGVPFLVDCALDRAVPPAEVAEIRSILTRDFRETRLPHWPAYFGSVLQRK